MITGELTSTIDLAAIRVGTQLLPIGDKAACMASGTVISNVAWSMQARS